MTIRTLPDVDRRHTKLGPAAKGQYDSIVSHLMRRLADGLDHQWPIERDEWVVLLRFLYSDHPELRPLDVDDL